MPNIVPLILYATTSLHDVRKEIISPLLEDLGYVCRINFNSDAESAFATALNNYTYKHGSPRIGGSTKIPLMIISEMFSSNKITPGSTPRSPVEANTTTADLLKRLKGGHSLVELRDVLLLDANSLVNPSGYARGNFFFLRASGYSVNRDEAIVYSMPTRQNYYDLDRLIREYKMYPYLPGIACQGSEVKHAAKSVSASKPEYKGKKLRLFLAASLPRFLKK